MMGYGSGMGGGMFVGLAMMLGLILLVVVVAWAIGGGRRSDGERGDKTSRAPDHAQPPAGRLLDERYARGEIGAHEYQERLSVLERRDGRTWWTARSR